MKKKILQLIKEDKLEFDKLPEKYKRDKDIFLQLVKKQIKDMTHKTKSTVTCSQREL